MGRGFWLPPGAEHMLFCDGFYVDGSAVYTGKELSNDWQMFLNKVCAAMTDIDRSFQRRCDWVSCDLGQSRFVLLQNDLVEIIGEDADGYVAVYVTVPKTCKEKAAAKRIFPTVLGNLRAVLVKLYPGAVSRRLNSQHTERVG